MMVVFSGGTGEKDRAGISHESFLLMANSQSDMEEWVRAIRRAIWAPLGGGVILKSLHTHKHIYIHVTHISIQQSLY